MMLREMYSALKESKKKKCAAYVLTNRFDIDKIVTSDNSRIVDLVDNYNYRIICQAINGKKVDEFSICKETSLKNSMGDVIITWILSILRWKPETENIDSMYITCVSDFDKKWIPQNQEMIIDVWNSEDPTEKSTMKLYDFRIPKILDFLSLTGVPLYMGGIMPIIKANAKLGL